jgi:hypothetical protein
MGIRHDVAISGRSQMDGIVHRSTTIATSGSSWLKPAKISAKQHGCSSADPEFNTDCDARCSFSTTSVRMDGLVVFSDCRQVCPRGGEQGTPFAPKV